MTITVSNHSEFFLTLAERLDGAPYQASIAPGGSSEVPHLVWDRLKARPHVSAMLRDGLIRAQHTSEDLHRGIGELHWRQAVRLVETMDSTDELTVLRSTESRQSVLEAIDRRIATLDAEITTVD